MRIWGFRLVVLDLRKGESLFDRVASYGSREFFLWEGYIGVEDRFV